jgi:AcrR family transcriptional regulator
MDALRARILGAARAALIEHTAATAVSVDSIAARAGVARTIVQKQFGSTAGLLEALFDQLTEHGRLDELPRALELADALAALAELVAVYARHWDSERELFRRLKSIAAFEPELQRALGLREEHRREGLRSLARRLMQRGVRAPADALDVLFALTSFEWFDSLAGPARTIVDVAPLAQHLARAAIAAPPRGAREH